MNVGRIRWFVVVAVGLGIASCSQDNPVKPRSSYGSSSSSSSSASSSSSGDAGAGGAGNAGGSGGQGDADAGTMGPTEAGPADPPCTNDLAFWALGMSFVSPTPQDLGQALSELGYDFTTHPISIVLSAKGGVSSAKLGVSATADDGMGLQVFPAGTKPTFVPAFLSYGGFESYAPQIKGTLHLVDSVGPVDIELNNIRINATTSSGCSNVVVVLNAEIPPTEDGKTLHLKAGNSTIGDLASGGGGGAGGKGGGPTSTNIRAFFSGETMSFDFTSL